MFKYRDREDEENANANYWFSRANKITRACFIQLGLAFHYAQIRKERLSLVQSAT